MWGANDTARILVVDDGREMAEMIADDLSERGFEAIATSSGHMALQKLRDERFDVLVTDLRMPGVDGLALLRASLALDPSRPVILMTAYGTLCAAVDMTAQGAYHYMTKPFRLDALFRVIEQALGRV